MEKSLIMLYWRLLHMLGQSLYGESYVWPCVGEEISLPIKHLYVVGSSYGWDVSFGIFKFEGSRVTTFLKLELSCDICLWCNSIPKKKMENLYVLNAKNLDHNDSLNYSYVWVLLATNIISSTKMVMLPSKFLIKSV